jgi:sugar lactone lactonase YvrE
MKRRLWLAVGLLAAGVVGCRSGTEARRPEAPPSELAREPQAGALEVVHAFHGPMPTGVAVSHEGRVFTNFPRWGDDVRFTVGEVRDGQVVPYPSAELNDPKDPERLLSVQSVVVDPRNRLWALDTGAPNLGPIQGQQWPKLVGIDLGTNQVFKVIHFPPEVVKQHTYLNDVRFDLSRGEEGLAFITDSGGGPNALIVVDLASGRSWRKLEGHPAVLPEPDFTATLEGEALMMRPPGQPPRPMRVGADGIALSADGQRLFFCALTGRKLYSVSVDALADPALPDAEVVRTLLGESRTFASDGLESDAQGRVYLTDYEHNALQVRLPNGQYRTLVTDERLWWPDTLALSTDGYLYVTANQLHRQARFHEGKDLRRQPYHLFRLKVDASPVLLGGPAPR